MNTDSFLIFAFLMFLAGLLGHYLIINSNKNKTQSDKEARLEKENHKLFEQLCCKNDLLNHVLDLRNKLYKEIEDAKTLNNFYISLLVAEYGATRLSGLQNGDTIGLMIQTPSGRLHVTTKNHELYSDLPIDKSWTWELALSEQGISTQEQIHQDLKLYANFAIQTKIAEERSFSTENPVT